jgi:hypothetical protein
MFRWKKKHMLCYEQTLLLKIYDALIFKQITRKEPKLLCVLSESDEIRKRNCRGFTNC